MSDRRRIVTIDSAGTVTTVKDCEDGVIFFAAAGSFQVKPGERHTIMASRNRRYGGATAAGESHDNGEISWTALVRGTTPDLALQNVENLLSVLEQPRLDLFFEWRPDGATNSVFYEIRGPAKWSTDYKWAQFLGAMSMMVTVAIPVGPLARGAATSVAITSTTTPAVVSLGTIGGDAPALADISLTHSGGASAPVWALLAWARHPGTPLAGSVAPFGLLQAETAASPTTWSVLTGNSFYLGGSGLEATVSGAGSASALFAVDPSVMSSDDFVDGQIQVEVWGRIALDASLVSPRVTLSMLPFAGVSFGAEQFTAEHGSSGKLFTKPGSGSPFRAYRLGTLTMPVDAASPLKWNVKVAISYAAGSSGLLGFDYLWMVPARSRALSPTAKPNDSSYPDFIASTAATTKTIRADLSGKVASGAGNAGQDSGLGGSVLELPPGDVDLLIKLSSLVPDDPTVDAPAEQLSHTVTGKVTVTPRYWLARGT